MIRIEKSWITDVTPGLIRLDESLPRKLWPSALSHELAHLELNHLARLGKYRSNNITRLKMEIDAWAYAAERNWHVDLDDVREALKGHMSDMTDEEVSLAVKNLAP